MMPHAGTTGARSDRRNVVRMRTDKQAQSATILERSVCLTLHCHILGNHRTVRTEDVVEATGGHLEAGGIEDGDQLNTTKKLVDSKELTPCFRLISRAKAYLRTKAIRAHRVFGDGSFLIPVGLVEEVDRELSECARTLRAEAVKLAGRYERAKEKQRAALGSLFDERSYPTARAVVESWSIDWAYVSFQAPEKLEHVNRALFEGAQRKFQQRMETAYHEVRLVLRETLRQLTGDIIKKLEPGPDGKPRVFRNTVLEGLADFLQSYDLRNIADDDELTAVVKKLKRLANNLDPQQLRDMEEVRTRVLADMQQATEKLDSLIETGRRAISFGPLRGE